MARRELTLDDFAPGGDGNQLVVGAHTLLIKRCPEDGFWDVLIDGSPWRSRLSLDDACRCADLLVQSDGVGR